MTDLPEPVTTEIERQTGSARYRVRHGATSIVLVPKAGCNVAAIEHAGRQLLKAPDDPAELPGFRYGVPVLYPTPGRVSGGAFTFDGTTYRFDPDPELGTLHGVVNRAPWELVDIESTAAETTLHCRLVFAPGSAWYEQFPLPHILTLAITVRDGAVRWTYQVDNTAGARPIPFGFALHPWFVYQGPRDTTVLTVAADRRMVLDEGKATGASVDVAGTPFDAAEGITLDGFVADDVYHGLQSARPTTIEFRETALRVTLTASDDFTHLVVYTPAGEPWFSVENWTSAPDAHHLVAQGHHDAAHLLVTKPGSKTSGHIELRIDQGA